MTFQSNKNSPRKEEWKASTDLRNNDSIIKQPVPLLLISDRAYLQHNPAKLREDSL